MIKVSRLDGAEVVVNAELIELLSEVLSVPRRSVGLERGAHSRTKTVRIVGLDAAGVLERLRAARRAT